MHFYATATHRVPPSATPWRRGSLEGASALPRRRAAAFTLLEVMLAFGILLMVLVVVYSSWVAILRSKKAGDKAALNAQRSRIAVRAIEDALQGVQFFQQNQPYYAFIADTSGDFGYLSLASRLPDSFPGSGLFGDQSLRRVTFEVERGTNGANQLVMRQYPLLLSTNRMEEAYPIILADEVTDFIFEFWDARRGEWLGEWLYTNQLPPVVRFMLGVGQRSSDPSKPQSVQVPTVAMTATPVPADLQRGMMRNQPRGTNVPPGANPNPNLNPGNPAGNPVGGTFSSGAPVRSP